MGTADHECPCPDDLESALSDQAVSVRESGDGICHLHIPFQYDYEMYVAEGSVSCDDPQWLTRTAELWREANSASSLNRELQIENEGFIRQVTEDLEELTFLRQISEHLELDRDGSKSGSIEMMLNLLARCVHAKQIFLLMPVSTDPEFSGDFQIQQTSNQLPPIVSPEAIQYLIDQYGEDAQAKPLVINHFDTELPNSQSVESFMLSPLTRNKKLLGYLLTVNRIPKPNGYQGCSENEFGTNESTMLQSAASMLAIHLMNIQLLDEKEALFTGTIRCLVTAIEAKDEYTRGHSERVALYGKRLGQQVGFNKEERERVYLSGLLHDVGKIGIADETLLKPGSLSEQEFNEIQRHPEEGWAILHQLKDLDPIMPGVLHHHERIDGAGYPDRLHGGEIPIDGRILAVADAYDAMTSDRPYRKGLTNERAIEILHEGAGTQWDSDLVQAFVEIQDDIQEIRDNYKPQVPPNRPPTNQPRQ